MARTLERAKTSRASLRNGSTAWCSTSVGRPSAARGPIPTTLCLRCRRRRSRLPRRPPIPVMSTVPASRELVCAATSVISRGGSRLGRRRSTGQLGEEARTLAERAIQELLDGLFDEPDLVVDHLVVVQMITPEIERFTKMEPILHGQGQLPPR